MELRALIDALSTLPKDFSPLGSLHRDVLEAIATHCAPLEIQHSVETGCGKSTALFSHLSRHHLVFAIDPYGTHAVSVTKESNLLDASTVEFIEGPTQRTLPRHQFDHPLDAIFLDGPHAYPFPELEYYFTYQFLRPGGVLILDDIQIPTIEHLFNFLRVDDMFSLITVVRTTAFFRRTTHLTFDPFADGWWLQNYNTLDREQFTSIPESLKAFVPGFVKQWVKGTMRVLGIGQLRR